MKTKINKPAMLLMVGALFTCLGFTNPRKDAIQADASAAITADDIIEYLENHAHAHWACCAYQIPGTSNWSATIENCGTATVVVNNGIVISHTDSRGICGE